MPPGVRRTRELEMDGTAMPRPESTAGATPARDPRREILAAASSLLFEGGSEGLTIRRLALRCGYTAPAIYQIFGDKAGLLDAILRETIDELFERINQVPEHLEPRERMRMRFREIVRFGREHPTNYRLIEALRPEQVPPIVDVVGVTKRLNEPLFRMASEGQLAFDPEIAQQALWALLHGLISLPASRPDVVWREGFEEVAFDALLAGLLGGTGSGRSK
jgi:AcrR family transcriptional regulator